MLEVIIKFIRWLFGMNRREDIYEFDYYGDYLDPMEITFLEELEIESAKSTVSENEQMPLLSPTHPLHRKNE